MYRHKRNDIYMLLIEQYRMNQFICNWPSKLYYNNNLFTSQTIINRQSILNQFSNHSIYSNSNIFFNIIGEENRDYSSIYNTQEAIAIRKTMEYLIQRRINWYYHILFSTSNLY